MRRWPKKGFVKESCWGLAALLGSLLDGSSTVLLRNQMVHVGMGSSSYLGFRGGGTSTPHGTISRIRHEYEM